MLSMPRIVFAASASACCAASRQDSRRHPDQIDRLDDRHGDPLPRSPARTRRRTAGSSSRSARGLLARHRAVDEALQRVPPDRPADREPAVAGDAARRAQPGVDRRVVGTTTEHHARHAVAAADPALLGDRRAVLGVVDALDLPDVGLDAGLLQLRDRHPHQARADLPVVPADVAAHRLQLMAARPAPAARTGTAGRCACSQSDSCFSRTAWRAFMAPSPAGL